MWNPFKKESIDKIVKVLSELELKKLAMDIATEITIKMFNSNPIFGNTGIYSKKKHQQYSEPFQIELDKHYTYFYNKIKEAK